MHLDADAIQSILDDLGCDDEAQEDAQAARLSGSALAAAQRRADAERKRLERARRREAGLPDPRTVDAAIVSAIAHVMRENQAAERVARAGSMDPFSVPMRSVFREAGRILREERRVARPAAVQALRDRIFGL
jgi:hypothetical protein